MLLVLLPPWREARLLSLVPPLLRLPFPAAGAAGRAGLAEEADPEDEEEEPEAWLACDHERRWKSFFGCASSSAPSPPPWLLSALASLCVHGRAKFGIAGCVPTGQ